MKKHVVFAVLLAVFLMPAFTTVSESSLANASSAVAFGPDPGAGGPNIFPLRSNCTQVGQILFLAPGFVAIQMGGLVSTGTYVWVPAFCGGTFTITAGPLIGVNGSIVFGGTCITSLYTINSSAGIFSVG